MPRIDIEYNKSEDQQQSTFMNATIQGNASDTIAFSIAVTAPTFDLDDPYQIAFVLDEALGPLVKKGYLIEVQIGEARRFDEHPKSDAVAAAAAALGADVIDFPLG